MKISKNDGINERNEVTEQIIHGDCLQVMKDISDKSIDIKSNNFVIPANGTNWKRQPAQQIIYGEPFYES